MQASALRAVRPPDLCRRLIGPALGGLIVAVVGAGNAFLIDAGTFLVSATAIPLMRTSTSRRHGTRDDGARRDVSGLRYVRSQRWLWVTFTISSLAMLMFFGPAEVLLPYIVRNELDGGAGDLRAHAGRRRRGLDPRVDHDRAARACPATTCRCSTPPGRVATLPFIGYALATHAWQLMVLAFLHGALITTGS